MNILCIEKVGVFSRDFDTIFLSTKMSSYQRFENNNEEDSVVEEPSDDKMEEEHLDFQVQMWT